MRLPVHMRNFRYTTTSPSRDLRVHAFSLQFPSVTRFRSLTDTACTSLASVLTLCYFRSTLPWCENTILEAFKRDRLNLIKRQSSPRYKLMQCWIKKTEDAVLYQLLSSWHKRSLQEPWFSVQDIFVEVSYVFTLCPSSRLPSRCALLNQRCGNIHTSNDALTLQLSKPILSLISCWTMAKSTNCWKMWRILIGV